MRPLGGRIWGCMRDDVGSTRPPRSCGPSPFSCCPRLPEVPQAAEGATPTPSPASHVSLLSSATATLNGLYPPKFDVTLPACVRRIELSAWNPPTSARRLAGPCGAPHPESWGFPWNSGRLTCPLPTPSPSQIATPSLVSNRNPVPCLKSQPRPLSQIATPSLVSNRNPVPCLNRNPVPSSKATCAI